jgi:osmotically-inducible protein OsmY
VDRQYERDEAEFVASNIVGALDVFDEIEIKTPTPSAADLKESITKAFKRNSGLDAKGIRISTLNGAVTLKGAVSSWAEHDQAVAAAWAAPGVTSVRDELTIAY